MKHYVISLLALVLASTFNAEAKNVDPLWDQHEKKLSQEEIKEKGIDVMIHNIVAQIDDIDIRKMARSDIFETPFGYRWKMVNLHTGKVLIVKVDQDFNLISVRDRNNAKVSISSL
ncbi:hypothetical protein EV197_1985 [Aquimarina brevivitae]|uniref:PepSY domain-containing protein n=2 Tax=Aquimarina brevivitae TaxID=323412 RepID=A0A4Q7P1G9_9FLAO|nr:hypothetical protein EV197_1985 [Aquimarina brevivitae]